MSLWVRIEMALDCWARLLKQRPSHSQQLSIIYNAALIPEGSKIISNELASIELQASSLNVVDLELFILQPQQIVEIEANLKKAWFTQSKQTI